MKYHIVTKNDVGNTFYMLVSNEPCAEICWIIDKTIATEFEYDGAERLIGALDYAADIKDLTIETSKEAWVLVCNVPSSPYLAGYNFSGPQWVGPKSKAMEFDLEEKAKEYSQALKTLFDIDTTPKKVS